MNRRNPTILLHHETMISYNISKKLAEQLNIQGYPLVISLTSEDDVKTGGFQMIHVSNDVSINLVSSN